MATATADAVAELDPETEALKGLLASRGRGVIATLRSDAAKVLGAVEGDRWHPAAQEGVAGFLSRNRERARRAVVALRQADYLESVSAGEAGGLAFAPPPADGDDESLPPLAALVRGFRFPHSVREALARARDSANRARSLGMKASAELRDLGAALASNRVGLADYNPQAKAIAARRDVMHDLASRAERSIAAFPGALAAAVASALEAEARIAEGSGEAFDLAEAMYEVATIGGDDAAAAEDAESRAHRARAASAEAKLSALGHDAKAKGAPAGRAARLLAADRAEAEEGIRSIQAGGRDRRRASARELVASAVAGDLAAWESIHQAYAGLPQAFLPGFLGRWSEVPFAALRDCGPAPLCLVMEIQ